MRLPVSLSRRKLDVHKNNFGHVLILAGSSRMLGAAALSGLAAMRCGAGLVTLGVPRSLNLTLQRKISPVLMTLPLNETPQQSFSARAYQELQKIKTRFDAVAIGPGLSTHRDTQRFILKVIATACWPLVIDADAINALAADPEILKKTEGIKILTPHLGEMARLTKLSKEEIERNRIQVAKSFAKEFKCIVVLKGHRSVVASANGQTYVNRTGNPGMATAGSGDVLTGMIAAFLGQGVPDFEAAKFAVTLHGKAGDFAAQAKTKIAMIASDIIDQIPHALRTLRL